MRIRAIILEGEADAATIAVIREAMDQPELSIVFAAPTVAEIAGRVAFETGVTVAEIAGDIRCQRATRVRDAVVLLARRLSGLSETRIANALGGRDHSSINTAKHRAERRWSNDPAFRLLVQRVTDHFAEVKPQ